MFAKQLLKTKFICPIQISQDTFASETDKLLLTQIYNHGRLSGTGYLSILQVDQGIEHTAGSSFAPNTMYFDPENIVKLAIEAGCNAIASRWVA
jgi:DhnA family fructose-bisphosphate aldolase class Ia